MPADPVSLARGRAALAVLRRGSSSGSAGNVAYVVYVVAIFAAVYGFPYGRTAFAALGSDRLAELAREPATGLLLALAYGGLLLLARTGGRVTGPVAPPPVWTRHVVAGPVDRAVALRRWWWTALGGVAGTGAVLGIFLGLSLWSAGVSGPVGVLVGALVLGLAGAVVAWVWLHAQARTSPPVAGEPRWAPAGLLRRLRQEDLLAQSARRTLVAGGVLLGQPQVLAGQLGGRRSAPAGRGCGPGPGSSSAVTCSP